MSEMRLYDTDGRRLYLNAEERVAFLQAAAITAPKTRLFAETLHYTCEEDEGSQAILSQIRQLKHGLAPHA